MNVKNFSYNGFSGQLLGGYAPYTAEFRKWTNDPGIMLCDCSDGKQRLIPTFAIQHNKKKNIPEQDLSNKVMFGTPSHS